MADGLGAVRRTPRPTGDHQTPETVAQLPRGATNAPTPVSTDARNGTDDLRAEVSDIAEALSSLRGRMMATAAIGGPDVTDDALEAFAALPDCEACEGTGKDDHGTPFEAPYAVHFAAPEIELATIGRLRQLCLWCGHVLRDVSLAEDPAAPWPVAALVRVEDGLGTVVPHEPGTELPPGCCALPDDGEPTPGPGCYPPADGWDGVATADVPVDPVDGYPVDLCGKHTGNCSNRCLLPAHHDGECDDDPRPDEAQETRAATDWPGEVPLG